MNRCSAADLASRLGVLFLGAAVATGCSGLARWEPVPLRVEEVRYEADVGPAPRLAGATNAVGTDESRGMGLNAGVVIAAVGGLGSRATGPVPELGDVPRQYGELFDNGFGFGASFILRRPAAGTVSVGDIFLLGGVEYVSYAGKVVAGTPLDTMTVIGFWLDAKTMLAPLGASGAWKPYILTGAGLTMISETGYGFPMYDSGIKAGLRGKLGLERRSGKFGLYVDIGVQVNTAPEQAAERTDPDAGDAEMLMTTPVGAGLIMNF